MFALDENNNFRDTLEFMRCWETMEDLLTVPLLPPPENPEKLLLRPIIPLECPVLAQVKNYFILPDVFDPTSLSLEWNGQPLRSCAGPQHCPGRSRPFVVHRWNNSVQFSCNIHHTRGRPRRDDPYRPVVLKWTRLADGKQLQTPILIIASRNMNRRSRQKY